SSACSRGARSSGASPRTSRRPSWTSSRRRRPAPAVSLTRLRQTTAGRASLTSANARLTGSARPALLRLPDRAACVLGRPGRGDPREGAPRPPWRKGASCPSAVRPPPSSAAPESEATGSRPRRDAGLARGRRPLPLGRRVAGRIRLLGADPVGVPLGRRVVAALLGRPVALRPARFSPSARAGRPALLLRARPRRHLPRPRRVDPCPASGSGGALRAPERLVLVELLRGAAFPGHRLRRAQQQV